MRRLNTSFKNELVLTQCLDLFSVEIFSISVSILLLLIKSSSAVGRTRHRLDNTNTCSYYAFRHITKSSSAAGRTRQRLGKTSTLLYVETHKTDKCLRCQADVWCVLQLMMTLLYFSFVPHVVSKMFNFAQRLALL